MQPCTAFHFDVRGMYTSTNYIACTYSEICIHVHLLILMYMACIYVLITLRIRILTCAHIYICSRACALPHPLRTHPPLSQVSIKSTVIRLQGFLSPVPIPFSFSKVLSDTVMVQCLKSSFCTFVAVWPHRMNSSIHLYFLICNFLSLSRE